MYKYNCTTSGRVKPCRGNTIVLQPGGTEQEPIEFPNFDVDTYSIFTIDNSRLLALSHFKNLSKTYLIANSKDP